MPFRFRAQQALDLRMRQEESARRDLWSARQQVAAAAGALATAEAQLADGLRRARDELAGATSTATSGWVRNWLAGQRREVAALHRALASRRDGERAAAGALVEASRRVRSLSHLKDRMWQEHALAERRAEQRELDWIGGLRYVTARAADHAMPPPQHAACGREAQA